MFTESKPFVVHCYANALETDLGFRLHLHEHTEFAELNDGGQTPGVACLKGTAKVFGADPTPEPGTYLNIKTVELTARFLVLRVCPNRILEVKSEGRYERNADAADPANLFQLGDFTLASGAKSAWKLECDALTDEDWEALAEMVRQMVGPFSSVEGVPRGGLKLAAALQKHAVRRGVNMHLIVDDVLTTGGSMERLRKPHCGQGVAGRPGVVGAVIFARGQCPSWIRAVFQMPESFWVQKREA